MRKANLLFVVVIAMLFAACGTKSNTKNDSGKLTGGISIDGSSTVYPITEAVAEEFRTVQPDVNITIGVSGTGGGFKKFGRGETDISNASRPIKDSEIELCKENNIQYHGISVAYDGMAVLINPENDWVDYLTVEELKKIWEPEAQDVIKKWNQIRPEWPDKEIHLYGPGVASGTYDYFTEVIVGKSGSSRGDFTASEDDNVLVQGIKGDVNSLGFFGLAYYEENQESLKLVPIDNGNGAILPSLETVSSNTYAPLSRPIYIYVNSVAAARPEVVEYINFYLENVNVLSQEVGYIPLPDEKYADEKQKFDNYLKSLTIK
jgi:phosphate transport system substrate-binding protein